MILMDLEAQGTVTTTLHTLLTQLIRSLLHGDTNRDTDHVHDQGPYLGVLCIHRCERRIAPGPGK